MNEFEPLIAKARALLAIIDPSNNASQGEVDNARTLLERLLERHEWLRRALVDSDRQTFQLECVSPRRRDKPGKHIELARLASQCIDFTTGDPKRSRKLRLVDYFTPVKGLRPDKCRRVYAVEVDMTKSEFDEWRACFNHYAPEFLETLEELKAEVKAARLALKMSLHGFVHKHNIFGPSDDVPAKPLSPEKLAALMAAIRAAKGAQFSRGRMALSGGSNLLEA
jgi:hypothetical protein